MATSLPANLHMRTLRSPVAPAPPVVGTVAGPTRPSAAPSSASGPTPDAPSSAFGPTPAVHASPGPLPVSVSSSARGALAILGGPSGSSRSVRALHAILIIVYVGVAAATGVIVWELTTAWGSNDFVIAWAVAGLCCCVAIPLPLHDILLHAVHYAQPPIQKFYIRILWVVPVYAIQSWLALRFYEQRIYFDLLRDLYEAFVLWSFYKCMVESFGAQDVLVQRLEEKSRAWMLVPLCYMQQRLTFQWLQRMTLGVLQYVFVRVVLSTLIFILALAAPSVYDDGHFGDIRGVYVYVVCAFSASQIVAMYCLVGFEQVFGHELPLKNPMLKLLSVKAIVFFIFWQGIIISGLDYYKYIPQTVQWSDTVIADGLQDFIVCVEMAAFAIAHHWFFSYTDFLDDFRNTGSHGTVAFVQGLLPLEIVKDTISSVTPRQKADTGRNKSPPRTHAPTPVRSGTRVEGFPSAQRYRADSPHVDETWMDDASMSHDVRPATEPSALGSIGSNGGTAGNGDAATAVRSVELVPRTAGGDAHRPVWI